MFCTPGHLVTTQQLDLVWESETQHSIYTSARNITSWDYTCILRFIFLLPSDMANGMWHYPMCPIPELLICQRWGRGHLMNGHISLAGVSGVWTQTCVPHWQWSRPWHRVHPWQWWHCTHPAHKLHTLYTPLINMIFHKYEWEINDTTNTHNGGPSSHNRRYNPL